MKLESSKINKILLIKPRGIGDIILSTIVLENLFNAFPNAEIHYLVEEFALQSVENNPSITKVLTMKKTEFIGGTRHRLFKNRSWIFFLLKERDFCRTVCMHGPANRQKKRSRTMH